jgi:hypothetical protein
LRADIHRLYDNGSITIKEDGKVGISKNVKISQYYYDLLKIARINAKTIKRIGPALKIAKENRH